MNKKLKDLIKLRNKIKGSLYADRDNMTKEDVLEALDRKIRRVQNVSKTN